MLAELYAMRLGQVVDGMNPPRRILPVAEAAGEYGLGRDQLDALIRASVMWRAWIPGQRYSKLARDAPEAGLRFGLKGLLRARSDFRG